MSAENPARRRVPAALVWIAVPVAVAAAAFIWWTASPLFISTRVDEAFPTAAQAAPTAMTGDTPPTPEAMAHDPMQPAAMTGDTPPTPEAMAHDPMQPAAPTEPVALASGDFTVIDSLHGAEGTATIYTLPDGQRVLRLEPFAAQNGPDLRIGLAAHPMPRSSAELHDTGAGYLELEGLKASEGSQNYVIPAGLDLSAYNSVVIYCRAFSVIFSTAELKG